jgi:hypothetical protein
MHGNYLVIPYTLSDYDIKINTHALVDCRYTGLSFMNEAFTYQYNFPHYPLKNPKTVEVINSYPISLGNIIEYVEVQCMSGDDHETLTAYLMSLRYYPLILGVPWLKRYDVTINFANNDIQFSSPGYLSHHAMVTPIPIKGLTPK